MNDSSLNSKHVERDDALCLEGALPRSGEDEARLPFAVDDTLLHGHGGVSELWAVRSPPPYACSRGCASAGACSD